MNKNKKLGFTLAEVLIVIGIIGVVAALTLPNLNHATGDKETVTRVKKIYSILSEANDRVVAIYGAPIEWQNESMCKDKLEYCWLKRMGEFLKISKSCNEYDNSDENNNCDNYEKGSFGTNGIVYSLPDGITFTSWGQGSWYCDMGWEGWYTPDINDICLDAIYVDINGPDKGKNQGGIDIFRFMLSNSAGILPMSDNSEVSECISSKDECNCTPWVIEFGNLDYLKADYDGKCNDSNIILDGVTNTSCH